MIRQNLIVKNIGKTDFRWRSHDVSRIEVLHKEVLEGAS